MKDNKVYTLYGLIFPNEYVYIGITSVPLSKRWGNNGIRYIRQPVYQKILEFGWNNIKKVVFVEGLSKDEAVEKEREYIDMYKNTTGVYNITKGGELGGDVVYEVEYKGKMYTYQELLKLSKVDDLTLLDLYHRINKHNWDVERALTQPKNVKLQPKGIGESKYFYEGEYRNTYELYLLRKDKSLSQKNIEWRINHGWEIEDALTVSPRNMNNKYLYKGQYYSSKELEALSPNGLSYQTIVGRIKLGWSVEDAVEKPTR